MGWFGWISWFGGNRWFGGKPSPEQVKRAKIAQYFAPQKRSIALDLIALGALIAGIAGLLARWDIPVAVEAVLAVVSLSLIGVGGYLIYLRTQRTTDDEIDVWRDQDIEAIIAGVPSRAGFEKQQLVEADRPIVIVGFLRFDKLLPAYSKQASKRKKWRFRVKIGADGLCRWTPPSLTVLHHTAHQLIAYQCEVDLLRGVALNETVEEYFWKDIVSLQIETETISFSDDEEDLIWQWAGNLPKKPRAKFLAYVTDDPKNSSAASPEPRVTLRLRTAGDGTLEIPLSDGRLVARDCDPAQHKGTWEYANSDAVARLRKLVRDHNQATLNGPPAPAPKKDAPPIPIYRANRLRQTP